MSDNQLIIELNQQPIELCKLLKIANLVSGGGEAKIVISEGYVYLNGDVEYQKRKKIYHNDIIEFNGDAIQVVINKNLAEHLTTETIATETIIPEHLASEAINTRVLKSQPDCHHNKQKNKADKKKKSPIFENTNALNETNKVRKRKPISF
ncbi:MAG: RNA-binding S4 domain-containing protein [Colwellia sp.]